MSSSRSSVGQVSPGHPSDILRIALVAASGFYYSPVFTWERPSHKEFPEDTHWSYCQQYIRYLRDAQSLLVVVRDSYEPDESSKTDLIPGYKEQTYERGAQVIVGLAVFKLATGQRRPAGFGVKDEITFPSIPDSSGRDKDVHHYEDLEKPVIEAENSYFEGCMTMENLVVHPAYWRRGHGTRLVRFGIDLAEKSKVNQGVVAARMGTRLYRKLGYQDIKTIHLEGDARVPDGVEVNVMMYKAKSLQRRWHCIVM